METFVAHPIDEAQVKAVKAFFEALQVPYEMEHDTSESPYDPEFVAKIKEAQESIKAGKGTVYTMEEFQALCK